MLTDTFVFAFYARSGRGETFRAKPACVSTRQREPRNNCFSDKRESRGIFEISRARINLDLGQSIV